MKFAYYPGCSLESTAWDFDRSTRAVCHELGIDLEEIEDWVCCGSTPAHTSNASLALALPVISLKKAKEMGIPVMAACASCYSRLRTTNYKLRNQSKLLEKIGQVTDTDYCGDVEVFHLLDVLAYQLGPEAIAQKVQRPLNNLRVVSYYGCLLSRPPEIVAFEDAEHPMSMDLVLEAAGATPVQWPYKTECCGAGLSISNPDVVNRLGNRLMKMAKEAKADCIALACPMCSMNLDLRQQDIIKTHRETSEMPVLYVTQLIGLAMGLSQNALGIGALSADPKPVLNRLKVDQAANQEGAL